MADPDAKDADPPFWRVKSLEEMSASEWESLCDGCGQCCLIRLRDVNTERVMTTRAACKLFDNKTCRCGDYDNRHALVDNCVKLTPQNIGALKWMPLSCAYRRLHEGRGLPAWHPLVSGDPESVHKAGVSVRRKTFSISLLGRTEDAVNYPAPEWSVDLSGD